MLDDVRLRCFHADLFFEVMRRNRLAVASPLVYGSMRGGLKVYSPKTQYEQFGSLVDAIEIQSVAYSAGAWRCAWDLVDPRFITAWGYDVWLLHYCAENFGDRGRPMGGELSSRGEPAPTGPPQLLAVATAHPPTPSSERDATDFRLGVIDVMQADHLSGLLKFADNDAGGPWRSLEDVARSQQNYRLQEEAWKEERVSRLSPRSSFQASSWKLPSPRGGLEGGTGKFRSSKWPV